MLHVVPRGSISTTNSEVRKPYNPPEVGFRVKGLGFRVYSPPEVDGIWGLGFRVYSPPEVDGIWGMYWIMEKKMETTV